MEHAETTNGPKRSLLLDLKKSRGFTLIEVLATLTISMILGSILLFNGRAGNQQLELNRAAQELTADMRLAQAYALSANADPVGLGGTQCESQGKFPYFALEIYVADGVPGEHLFYADCNANNKFNANGDAEISRKHLNKVAITATNPSPNGSPPSLDISYIPPIPTVRIKNNSPSFAIRLQHLDNPDKCLDVRGNNKGNIEIDTPGSC